MALRQRMATGMAHLVMGRQCMALVMALVMDLACMGQVTVQVLAQACTEVTAQGCMDRVTVQECTVWGCMVQECMEVDMEEECTTNPERCKEALVRERKQLSI